MKHTLPTYMVKHDMYHDDKSRNLRVLRLSYHLNWMANDRCYIRALCKNFKLPLEITFLMNRKFLNLRAILTIQKHKTYRRTFGF